MTSQAAMWMMVSCVLAALHCLLFFPLWGKGPCVALFTQHKHNLSYCILIVPDQHLQCRLLSRVDPKVSMTNISRKVNAPKVKTISPSSFHTPIINHSGTETLEFRQWWHWFKHRGLAGRYPTMYWKYCYELSQYGLCIVCSFERHIY